MDIEHSLLEAMGKFFPEPDFLGEAGLVEELPSSLGSTMSTYSLCSSSSGKCNRSLLSVLDCLSFGNQSNQTQKIEP